MVRTRRAKRERERERKREGGREGEGREDMQYGRGGGSVLNESCVDIILSIQTEAPRRACDAVNVSKYYRHQSSASCRFPVSSLVRYFPSLPVRAAKSLTLPKPLNSSLRVVKMQCTLGRVPARPGKRTGGSDIDKGALWKT